MNFGEMRGTGATIAQLATSLAPFAGRAVQDRTGATGAFDFELQFTPDPVAFRPRPGAELPAASADRPSIFTAVQEQLGLKLESATASDRGPRDRSGHAADRRLTLVPMAQEIVLRRLYWVGPATIAASVAAVLVVQQISLFVLHDLPKFSDSILHSNEPAYATAFFVGCAVLIFPIIADAASKPLRTFRRLALGVLLVSCIPNLARRLRP